MTAGIRAAAEPSGRRTRQDLNVGQRFARRRVQHRTRKIALNSACAVRGQRDMTPSSPRQNARTLALRSCAAPPPRAWNSLDGERAKKGTSTTIAAEAATATAQRCVGRNQASARCHDGLGAAQLTGVIAMYCRLPSRAYSIRNGFPRE